MHPFRVSLRHRTPRQAMIGAAAGGSHMRWRRTSCTRRTVRLIAASRVQSRHPNAHVDGRDNKPTWSFWQKFLPNARPSRDQFGSTSPRICSDGIIEQRNAPPSLVHRSIATSSVHQANDHLRGVSARVSSNSQDIASLIITIQPQLERT
jgi:hypothetical protein